MTAAQALPGLDLLGVIRFAFWLLQALVFARVIISWVPVNRYHPLVRFVHNTTEPLLRPFRAVVPMGRGGIDFSPMILFLVLLVVERLLVGLVAGAR